VNHQPLAIHIPV